VPTWFACLIISVLLSGVRIQKRLRFENMVVKSPIAESCECGIRYSEISVLVFSYISMTAWRLCWALSALVLLALPTAAQNPTPVGVWLHPDKRIEIEIAPCGDRLCAKIVWFKRPNGDDGLPLADVKNKDLALRTRPLLGLNVLQGLRAAGENNWEDGEVYNPDDGINYRARMSIDRAGDLRIRAFLLLPLLGHTMIWTPVR